MLDRQGSKGGWLLLSSSRRRRRSEGVEVKVKRQSGFLAPLQLVNLTLTARGSTSTYLVTYLQYKLLYFLHNGLVFFFYYYSFVSGLRLRFLRFCSLSLCLQQLVSARPWLRLVQWTVLFTGRIACIIILIRCLLGRHFFHNQQILSIRLFLFFSFFLVLCFSCLRSSRLPTYTLPCRFIKRKKDSIPRWHPKSDNVRFLVRGVRKCPAYRSDMQREKLWIATAGLLIFFCSF